MITIDKQKIADKFLVALPSILMLIAGIGGTLLYFHFKPQPAPVGIQMPARPAPEVAHETRVPAVVQQPLQVYKPAVKKKLRLPQRVQQNENQHVLAATKTANDERQHTVTTVVDTQTGTSETFDRVEPLPWIAVNTKTQVGIIYGIKQGKPVGRLQAEQEFLQVKALHFGGIASLDSDATYFVGVGVWARW